MFTNCGWNPVSLSAIAGSAAALISAFALTVAARTYWANWIERRTKHAAAVSFWLEDVWWIRLRETGEHDRSRRAYALHMRNAGAHDVSSPLLILDSHRGRNPRIRAWGTYSKYSYGFLNPRSHSRYPILDAARVPARSTNTVVEFETDEGQHSFPYRHFGLAFRHVHDTRWTRRLDGVLFEGQRVRNSRRSDVAGRKGWL